MPSTGKGSSHKQLTTQEFWDKWWSPDLPLDDPIPAHECEFGANGFFLRAIERQMGSLRGKAVVELGGSMSNSLLAMAKWRDVKATIIDYSAAGIERSKRFFRHNGCAVEALCCDFFDQSVGDRRFDLVMHRGVLEHFVDPAPLIKRSIELASARGHIIVTMPQMQGLGAWGWRTWSPNTWKLHVFHSDEEIFSTFERYGARCRRFFFGPPFLHIEPCERSGVVHRIASRAQFWARKFGKFRWVPYDRGLPRVSMVRGFVAQKVR